MQIRSVSQADADVWLRMRLALWPADAPEHQAAIDGYFAGHRHEATKVLVAFASSGAAIGFVELSIRSHVDRCATDHVGYIEGWYVVPESRRQGIGRALIAAAEQWAVGQGCTEFGSDALIDNHVSRAAHLALGFEETHQVRNFRKNLPRRA